jgi:G3E family GTPase
MRAEVAVAAGAKQQHALEGWLHRHPYGRRAVIAENAFGPLVAPPDVPLLRLTAGCVCCVGVVPLRVGIARIVRTHRPDDLLLLVGSGDHVARVRSLLTDGSLGARFDVE